MAERKCTPKQEKYVLNLISGLSQRKAYRKAFGNKNSSDKTIDNSASKLFRTPHIKARYIELRDRAIAEAEEEGIVNRKKLIREALSIANDDIGNYVRFGTKEIVERDEDGQIIIGEDGSIMFDETSYAHFFESDEIDTKNISEVEIKPDGSLKIKRYDRDKALYKLMDYIGKDDEFDKMLKLEKLNLDKERFEFEKKIKAKEVKHNEEIDKFRNIMADLLTDNIIEVEETDKDDEAE